MAFTLIRSERVSRISLKSADWKSPPNIERLPFAPNASPVRTKLRISSLPSVPLAFTRSNVALAGTPLPLRQPSQGKLICVLSKSAETRLWPLFSIPRSTDIGPEKRSFNPGKSLSRELSSSSSLIFCSRLTGPERSTGSVIDILAGTPSSFASAVMSAAD